MRCFSSPGSLHTPMDSRCDDPKGSGCPIRKSMDQSALATPHGLSQRATSFIASRCQGIHQMLLRRLTRPHIPLRAKTPRQNKTTGQDRVRLLKTGAQHTPETPKRRTALPTRKDCSARPRPKARQAPLTCPIYDDKDQMTKIRCQMTDVR